MTVYLGNMNKAGDKLLEQKHSLLSLLDSAGVHKSIFHTWVGWGLTSPPQCTKHRWRMKFYNYLSFIRLHELSIPFNIAVLGLYLNYTFSEIYLVWSVPSSLFVPHDRCPSATPSPLLNICCQLYIIAPSVSGWRFDSICERWRFFHQYSREEEEYKAISRSNPQTSLLNRW